jgi:uncharacterized RDD family membrane protein YckC
MFKDALATVLEIAGIMAVCVAIFLVSPVLALGAAGVAMFVVGFLIDGA